MNKPSNTSQVKVTGSYDNDKVRKLDEMRHKEYYAKYDPQDDAKHVSVVNLDKTVKDVNPRLKINYSGRNFRDTTGPRDYSLSPLKEGQSRARFLFVMMDQHDSTPKWTFGPGYLAAVLKANDYDVEVFHGTAFHWGADRLARLLREAETFDYIGFGFLSNYVHQLIEHIKVCREASPRSKIILGSNGFSPLPAFYLAKTGADYGVSGEAENSLLNLLNALSADESPENLPSVSFRDGEDIYVSKSREPVPEITTIPWPSYELFPIEKYITYRPEGYKKGRTGFEILTSRGCPYRCNFCSRLEEGIRVRPFEDVFSEILFLYENMELPISGTEMNSL